MSGRCAAVRRVAAVAVGLALAGCAVGPDYREPEPDVPAAWSAALPSTAADPGIDEAWWAAFGDPLLSYLVERALIANPDVVRAEAVVAEARALRSQAQAAFFPEIDGSGSITHRRQTTTGNTTSFGGLGLSRQSGANVNTFYQSGFDSSWEFDLFGRTRRSVEAADAFQDAQEASANDVRLTLIGDVARFYVDARGLQRRIEVTRRTIGAQRDTVALTRAKFQAGTGSGLDAVRAEAQLATFEAALPPLQASLAEDIHRLGVLTGQPPEALVGVLDVPAPVPISNAVPQAGIPADLLRRRPDIRNAERLLAQATANIGVAVADRYPSLTLPGSLALDNTKAAELFTSASVVWAVGPQVTVPLFDAGRRRSEVEARFARQEQARASYRQTVLNSLEEVENALVAYAREAERRRALQQSAVSNADAVALATELYTRGLGTFLDVLDAQRALFDAESSLAASEAALSTDLVAIYKALGGGWAVRSPLLGSADAAR